MEFNDHVYAVVGHAMLVHTTLGPGLREAPYENALAIELAAQGLAVAKQKPYPILFRDQVVGDCIPDLTVEHQLLVDAKSIDAIGDREVAQMLNYLRISKIRIGLILNFRNPRLEWKRVVK